MIRKINKYHNQKVKTLNHGTFDSKLEFQHFKELEVLEKAGKIDRIFRQVRIPLGKSNAIKYVADFVFWDIQRDCYVIWDSKGLETKEFKVKRAWLLDDYVGFVFIQAGKTERKEFKPSSLDGNEKCFFNFMFNYVFNYKEKLAKKAKKATVAKNAPVIKKGEK